MRKALGLCFAVMIGSVTVIWETRSVASCTVRSQWAMTR